jgi:acetyl esterase/lipase
LERQEGQRTLLHLSSTPQEQHRIILHFHGGGFCIGSPRQARSWASHLVHQGDFEVILPTYPLSPESPWPLACDDVYQTWRRIVSLYGAERIVLSGDSAGANLALGLTQRLRDEGSDLPSGLILLSPWLDLSNDRSELRALLRSDRLLSPAWLRACATAYAVSNDLRHPSISPLFGDLTNLPPTIIQAGTSDLLLSDADAIAEKAQGAGVAVTYLRIPNGWHDVMLQCGLVDLADDALLHLASWLNRLTST